MNCIIVEDQPPAQRILKKFIEDMGSLNLKATFSDAITTMEFLKTNAVDIIFLDVHLPKMSGIDFLKIAQNPPQIILTTAFPDYALESYEFDVADYLLKPFSFQRFVKAVSKVKTIKATPTSSSPKELFIKLGYELVKINTDEIIYIKSDTDYTELFLKNKKHLTSESLRYWEQTLDNVIFTRIHKSYIINTTKIEKIAQNQVFLTDNISLPIGRVYKDKFMSMFKQ